MELKDIKNSSKDAIIKWYLTIIKETGILDNTHLTTYEENLSSVLDYYLVREDITNDEIETLLILNLYLSSEEHHIMDAEKYAEYTIERYRKWFDYYQKVHLVNPKITPSASAINKVKEEIIGILKDSDEG